MNGILLIDKPSGITSHDVIDHVRRIIGTRAVGHAGTLDPLATGLLILGVGKATKELSHYVGLDKEYEAELTLGATSHTFDAEGMISPKNDRVPTQKEIERTLDQFRGTFEQRAPLFSAKKMKGKKLYDLARAGKADESMRPSKQITITSLHIMRYVFPRLTLDVHCSSGTYIRSLADDIGQALGTGAYLSKLRRIAVGPFRVDHAQSLDQITMENIINDEK